MKIKNLLIGSLLMPFALMAQQWHENFDQVLKLAKEENKLVLLVFSGSDWCAPCIKLNKRVWQSQVFQEYADKNYVLYKADFPRRKSNRLPEAMLNQNKTLAQRFNTEGFFPLVILMNYEETILGKTGYQKMDASEYIGHLNSFLLQ